MRWATLGRVAAVGAAIVAPWVCARGGVQVYREFVSARSDMMREKQLLERDLALLAVDRSEHLQTAERRRAHAVEYLYAAPDELLAGEAFGSTLEEVALATGVTVVKLDRAPARIDPPAFVELPVQLVATGRIGELTLFLRTLEDALLTDIETLVLEPESQDPMASHATLRLSAEVVGYAHPDLYLSVGSTEEALR